MSNKEGKKFLQLQIDDPSSASTVGADKHLADKQVCKDIQTMQAATRKEKSTARISDQSTSAARHSSSGETSSDSDTDFVAPIVSKFYPAKKLKRTLVTSKGHQTLLLGDL